jgi:thioredoxin 1
MPYTREYSEREPTRTEIDADPGPLVVEFGAPWCGYCQGAQPAIAETMARYPDVKHVKIYDGRGKPLGRSFRVKLWPTLVLMREGKVLAQTVRPTAAEIERAFETFQLTPKPLEPTARDH